MFKAVNNVSSTQDKTISMILTFSPTPTHLIPATPSVALTETSSRALRLPKKHGAIYGERSLWVWTYAVPPELGSQYTYIKPGIESWCYVHCKSGQFHKVAKFAKTGGTGHASDHLQVIHGLEPLDFQATKSKKCDQNTVKNAFLITAKTEKHSQRVQHHSILQESVQKDALELLYIQQITEDNLPFN